MNLGAIQTALTDWFENVSGLAVEWFDEPYAMHTQPFALLAIGEIMSPGIDGTSYAYDAGTDNLAATMFGLRRFTLHVRVRAFDQRQAYAARQQLETARLRFLRHSSLSELSAANLALCSSGPLTEQDYDFDDRRISQINMDLVFETRVSEVDSDWSGDYINRVTGTGDMDDPDLSVPFDSDDA